MSRETILARGRLAAEKGMTSTATVRRPGGPPTTDANGFEVDGWLDIYSGPFRLGGSSSAGSTRKVTIGDIEVELAVRVAHFPATTTEGLRDGDVIEVASGENAGVFLRIIEADWQDQATARRLPVVSATRPEGWL